MVLALLWAIDVPLDASFTQVRAPLRVMRVDSSGGLSHNSVYAVLRDRHGFVWAGTPDGLNRFDGYEVRRYLYDPEDPASLSHQIVRSLLEDRAGNLWIGTDNGLNLIDRAANRFRRVTLRRGESEAREVVALFEDSRGTLWAGTDRGVFRRVSGADGFEPFEYGGEGEPRDFAESPGGVVWALVLRGTESKLHALDGPGSLNVSAAWGLVTSFAIDAQGRFWLKPPRPATVDASTNQLVPSVPGDRLLTVNRVRLAGDRIWMATDRGLCHGPVSSGVGCRPIDSAASWLHNYVRDVWVDEAGAVWFGTYTGLSRFDPTAKPFETWKHDARDPQTLSGDAVSAVVEQNDGSLWVGTFGGGLNRIDRARGAVTRFRARPSDPFALPHDTIWALLVDPAGVLWIGTEDGLASFDPRTERFLRHAIALPHDERVGRRTTALARDRSGILWLAAAGGLCSYDPRSRTSRWFSLPRPQDARENIAGLVIDDAGTIWTGTGAVGLRRFDPASGRFEDFPRLTRQGVPLSSEGFWDLHPDGRGGFWVATGMGLSRFDRETKTYENFLPRDGLPASMIYSIAVDGRGRLWLGTSRGLVRFDPEAKGVSRFRAFETTDGIAGLEFNRHAATRTRSGELCFGGIGGLTCFDPERIEDDRRLPRVVFTGIEVTRGTTPVAIEPFGRESIELRHEDDPFGFVFAALSFTNPQKNLYRYTLEGFDRGWIDAGTRRQARYTNVPPGEYVFRVRASNADGTWNLEGASIRVKVLPPFWATWWFRLAVAAAAAVLLYALDRHRVARLIEMERLRLRIASDLHDDVTSELSGISMMAEVMRRRSPAAAEQLGQLRDRATALASLMRDLAWGIHPEHDTAGSMVRRMHSTGAMLLGDTPLSIHTDGLDDGTPLPMLPRRTLFLIFKEALHNAARHAGAGQVNVSLRSTGGALEMTIADDGAGFDPESAHAGDGLRNMRRRLREIGGEMDIRSGAGKGTEIAVRVPLRPGDRHEHSGWPSDGGK